MTLGVPVSAHPNNYRMQRATGHELKPRTIGASVDEDTHQFPQHRFRVRCLGFVPVRDLLQGWQGELHIDPVPDRGINRTAHHRCSWLLSHHSQRSSVHRLSGGLAESGGGPENKMNK